MKEARSVSHLRGDRVVRMVAADVDARTDNRDQGLQRARQRGRLQRTTTCRWPGRTGRKQGVGEE